MNKFDDVLRYLGEFGAYQRRIYFLLCLFCVTHGMRMVVLVFILSMPNHRCAIPSLTNDTFQVQSPAHEWMLNMSVPPKSSCHLYAPGNYTYDSHYRPINASRIPCNLWVYDTSVFTTTVASQFDLVCDQATKRSHATMTFYGGFLIGVVVFGAVSDLIGRKLTLFMSLSLLLMLGTGLAFSNSFITFAILNFLVGASTTGIFSSAFVISIELVGPSKRTLSGMFIQLFFSLGVVGTAGLAFLFRDWHHLQLIITVPLVLFYFAWCAIPESPRWQIQKGKFVQARATVNQAAKVNGRSVPETVLDSVIPPKVAIELKPERPSEDNCASMKKEMFSNGGQNEKQKIEENKLLDLFRSKVLCIRTCVLFFNWAVVSLTFYGLNFNTGNLGAGSIFLNFFLAGSVEFPAHITTIFTIDRFGRKIVHFAMLTTSGLACLLCVFSIVYAPAEHQWMTVALAMLAKFGAAGGFGTIYLYSTELFPTLIRNSAIGASSSWARAGAMLAPYVAAQGAKTGGPLGRGVPLLICGSLVLVAGLLSLLLPETLNRRLPETVEDAKNLSKYTEANVEIEVQEDHSDTRLTRPPNESGENENF